MRAVCRVGSGFAAQLAKDAADGFPAQAHAPDVFTVGEPTQTRTRSNMLLTSKMNDV
jgi:hypothetical protein